MSLDHKVFSTEEILKDLDKHIKKKLPFSTVRYGDAVYGIIASYLCPDLIPVGKWSGLKGKKKSSLILGQLTIPPKHRLRIVKRVVKAADNANYCDSYAAYSVLNTSKIVGILARNWKEIHKCVGITNENYCSCFLHYFSIIEGEYNLFDIMKDRKVFCITSKTHVFERLKSASGAKLINGYKISGRGRKGKHYREHFKNVIRTIRQQAKNYDFFLVSSGLLGKVYCDEIKANGGCAFDSGRLFDFWAGKRTIDSRPKRFLKYDGVKMLCKRIRSGDKSGVW